MQNGVMRRTQAYLTFNPNPNSEVKKKKKNQLKLIFVNHYKR
jgi:hypothetical protein